MPTELETNLIGAYRALEADLRDLRSKHSVLSDIEEVLSDINGVIEGEYASSRIDVALAAMHNRERSGCAHFASTPAPDLCCDRCKVTAVVDALDGADRESHDG